VLLSGPVVAVGLVNVLKKFIRKIALSASVVREAPAGLMGLQDGIQHIRAGYIVYIIGARILYSFEDFVQQSFYFVTVWRGGNKIISKSHTFVAQVDFL
jgi:hypothetical protein